jgi:molybdopterin-guanine dinucleotide biosynthesis protein A
MLPVSAIVLAGGQSRRLKVDKMRLTFGTGETLLARVCRLVGHLCTEIIIVGQEVNRQDICSTRWEMDIRPGFGALGGLYSGLRHASNEDCLVVAGDMPFLSLSLLKHMFSIVRNYDVLVPCFDNFIEPLHAVYNKRCIGPIEHLMDRNQRRIFDFYPDVQVRNVRERDIKFFDPHLRSFFNINALEQLAEAWVIEIQNRQASRAAAG